METPLTNQRGFSLVELLAALTIAAIITTLLTHSLKIGVKTWERDQERTRFFTQAQRALALITGEIRESDQLTKVGPDTLELIKGGNRIRYLCQCTPSEGFIRRMVEEGGEWKERPQRPLTIFNSIPSDSTVQLTFTEPSSSLVRVKLSKGKLQLSSASFKRGS